VTRAITFLFLFTLSAVAQVELQRPSSAAAPRFYFQALNFKSPDGESRIDFYSQIPYSRLHFVKDGSGFSSSYTITVRLTGEDEDTTIEETWGERALCREFDETLSDQIVSSAQRHFALVPGSYAILVNVTEPETGNSLIETTRIEARDFSASATSISDIIVLLASSETGGKRTIIPNIQGNVFSSRDSFPIFYEVYSTGELDSVYVTAEVIGAESKVLYKNSRWIPSKHLVTRVFENIPKAQLPMSHYRLRVSLRGTDDERAGILASTVTSFSIHFSDLPPTITDLDKAAEEMMFIAKPSTIDSIKASPDLNTKKSRFLEFWRGYRSSYSTDERVLMEEYFNRVAYANEHFTHFFAGWQSDRGMIYIIFGPPDNVERRPFNSNSKPYEIWQYYRKAHTFVFIDDTGFGDYRLRTTAWDNNSPQSGMDFSPR
jgi:GWxTD domain-containing protein